MNYESMIYEELEGDTPRKKYEYLKALEKRAAELQGTVNFAYINFKALSTPPSPAATLTICEAVANTLSRSVSEETKKLYPPTL